MKSRRAWIVAAIAMAACLVFSGQVASAGENESIIRLSDIALDFNLRLDTTGARAIVAAKFNEDKPANPDQHWPCRLIHNDPNKQKNDQWVRHVDPGALLVLVNLTDETVTFKFGADVFVAQGRTFTLSPDQIKVLKVKEGIEIAEGNPEAGLLVSSEQCFTEAPGPIVPIP